jgi:glycosyltransferase involved in cell wall biosynthesis
MKLLLVHNAYQYPGGEDTVFEREAALLREHGHTVVTYTRSNAEVRDFSPAAKALLPLRMIWARDAVRDLRALIAAEKPDVAHFHNTHFMISPAAYFACREAGVPVVQTLHNYRLSCPAATFFRAGRICEDCLGKRIAWPGVVHACYRDSRVLTGAVAASLAFHRLRRTWSQAVNVYIALTEFGRQKFVQAGLPAHKIAIKPNFVSPDPGWREPTGNYAIYLGRLSPEKGCRELLHAWQSLGGISLKVIGAGPLRDELVAYAGHHGPAQIEFVDWLPREAALDMLRHARAMVFPSTLYEGLPMSIIEAFACGVPVIASRTGAMAEIVTDGVTGLHFTAGDAADLAAKVRWAWDHPAEMAEMGRAARREYEQKYTAERNYAQLLRIYEMARAR